MKRLFGLAFPALEIISATATSGGAKVSCLHKGNNATLGLLHFPDALEE